MTDPNVTPNRLNITPNDLSRTRNNIEVNSKGQAISYHGGNKDCFCLNETENLRGVDVKLDQIKSKRLRLIIQKDKDGKIDNVALKESFEEYKAGESS